MLKDKEVVSDPQRQYEIARNVHALQHGGINKTTATIAEKFHWVRIKETVSLVIKNCPDCKETAAKIPTVRPMGDNNNNMSNGGAIPQLRNAAASSNGQGMDPNSMIERLVHFDQLDPPTPNRNISLSPSSPGTHTPTVPVANMHVLQNYNDIPLDPQIMGPQPHAYQPHPPSYPDLKPVDNAHYIDIRVGYPPRQSKGEPQPETRMADVRGSDDEPMTYQDEQSLTDGAGLDEQAREAEDMELEELLSRS
jgi:hypothetical protein